MNTKEYLVGIVGFGGMGNWHRELLEGFDNIACGGSYDIDPVRQEAARDLGLKVYDSFEAILADEKIDIILIATPNDTHRELTVKALEAGKHVVCEKPVTMTSEDFAAMVEAAEKNDRIFMVHQNRRWDGDYRAIKKVFESDKLGEIFSIESRVHGSRGIPGDWRGLKEHGGGMILDWGVHILDQLLMMIPGKVKTVYAKTTHVTNELVDDGFRIVLEFENNISALAEVGTSNFISLPRWYMLGRDGTAIVEDFYDRGKIVNVEDWDAKDAIPVKTAAGLTKTMAPRTPDTIKESPMPVVESDIRDFYINMVESIEGKSEPLIKNREVMRCMLLMEKAFESNEKGQILNFE